MNDRFLFLQLFSKFLDYEQIDVAFQCPPPLDRSFWDKMTRCMETEDHKTLEAMAAILRANHSDFYCMEKFRFLLRSRGFDVETVRD